MKLIEEWSVAHGNLLLARHGETDFNCAPVRVQGSMDVPLNENGLKQAAQLAELVADEERPIAALYTSSALRAQQTAEIVGKRLGITPTVERRLIESNRGRWEGLLFSEVAERYPDSYVQWRNEPSADFRFPGGESLGEQSERVSTALKQIVASDSLPALAICHGGSIRVALCAASGKGLAAFHGWDVPNGSLVRV